MAILKKRGYGLIVLQSRNGWYFSPFRPHARAQACNTGGVPVFINEIQQRKVWQRNRTRLYIQ